MTGNQCGRASYTKISRRTTKFKEISRFSRSCRHPVLLSPRTVSQAWRRRTNSCQLSFYSILLSSCVRFRAEAAQYVIIGDSRRRWRRLEMPPNSSIDWFLDTAGARLVVADVNQSAGNAINVTTADRQLTQVHEDRQPQHLAAKPTSISGYTTEKKQPKYFTM